MPTIAADARSDLGLACFSAGGFVMADRYTDEKDFFAAVGYVAYCSTRMFNAIEVLIAGMLARSEGVEVLTVDLSYAQINHLANALADRIIKGKKELSVITSILKDASRYYEERNKIIHGTWAGCGGEYMNIRWRARGKYTQLETDFDTADILAVAKGLEECGRKLFRFTQRKRFLNHTMFDQSAGMRRQWLRERDRERELLRNRALKQKAR